MKYLLCVILLGLGKLTAQNSLDKIVEFECDALTTADALLSLSEISEITIAFNPQIFSSNNRITINLTSNSIENFLKEILQFEKVGYKELGNQIIIFKIVPAKYTIKGYVTDRDNGEFLPGANIFIPQLKKNITSNEFGFFSITLDAGEYQIVTSYIGYEIFSKKWVLKENAILKIELKENSSLEEVLIVANENDSIGIGNLNNLKKIPVKAGIFFNMPGGESDVLKLAQFFPGVTSGVDGIGGLHVRGGNADQNLLLLDDVTIYNSGHIFGLLSVFNDQIIKDLQFWKGNFPARYSGRTSSVLEVRTKEGSLMDHQGDLSLSLVAAKAMVEGYLVKNKCSYILSARKSYIDPLVAYFSRKNKQSFGGAGEMNYSFYDINAKIHWIANDQNKFYLSFYNGKDNFADATELVDTLQNTLIFSNNKLKLNWGNIAAALRWNKVYGNRLFSNTTLTYSKFTNQYQSADYLLADGEATIASDQGILFRSEIEDITSKIDFSWFPSPRTTIRFGGGYTFHKFNPGVVSFFNYFISGTDIDSLLNSLTDSLVTKEPRLANESYIYFENEFIPNSKWRLYLGANLSAFNIREKVYRSLQPRFEINYAPVKKLILNAGFSKMTQYLHQLNSFNAGLPNDLWVPATDRYGPQHALQGNIGAVWSEKNISIQSDLYYKYAYDIISFREGASFLYDGGSLESDRWENQITSGIGRSHGLELLFKYKARKLTTWVSYTFSKSDRLFEDINLNRPFLFGFDRRHSFKSILAWQISPLFSVSANWTYETGNPITLSAVKYQVFSPVSNTTDVVFYVGERNEYILPPLHRLDLGIQLSFPQKKVNHELHLGIYNVYNRKNPFLYYILLNNNDAEVRQLTVLPILPVIKYRIHFK